ncbi:hypothetical protein V6N12_074391 [Hibiscus sabdariffa]|uniref:Uncharacterized protein n=1 Tax=Hibiscus sabdariffa TaxID=183260 RepID=A0ABR2BL15_9ROSI
MTLEESPDLTQQHPPPHQQLQTGRDVASDDERSVAADSWSIKSDYGSTLDDDQRHADAAEVLSSAANFRASPYYIVLGLQSYRNGTANADELVNFHEHGNAGEIWIGADIMDTVTSWTKSLCIDISKGHTSNQVDDASVSLLHRMKNICLAGVYLTLALATICSFKNLLSRLHLLVARVYSSLTFKFKYSLSPEISFEKTRHPGGGKFQSEKCWKAPNTIRDQETHRDRPPFQYLNHVPTYPKFVFNGSSGSHVATVAFQRN